MPRATAKPSPSLSEEQQAAERRRTPRFPSDLQTSCRPLTSREGNSWSAQVVNLSSHGIALLLGRRFEPGTVLTMELEDASQTVRRSVFARVIHVHAHEGAWTLGCAFTSELDDDELRAFRAERVRPEGSDCRAWVRFDCDVASTCRDAANAEAEEVAVRIVNVAPGGVGLVSAVPWDKGTILWLQLPGAPGQPSRRAVVRVAQAGRPVGDRWLHGCEFADPLRDEDLQGLVR